MGANMKENAKKALGEIMSMTELKTPSEIREAAEHSMHGFVSVLLGEKAFRTDIVVFAVCTAVALAIPGLSFCERALLVYSAFVPLIAELINTAIEKTIDRISTEHHWLSGLAKDIGSSLVFMAFFGAGITWAIILFGVALKFWRGAA